jgi:hypothetical protein
MDEVEMEPTPKEERKVVQRLRVVQIPNNQ